MLICQILGPTAQKFPGKKGLDLGSIIYTSGSTGEPKGVMFIQKQVVEAFAPAKLCLNSIFSSFILADSCK